ncbi:DUF4229 domain-containing protein [Nocardioides limicola]|uniref:DUF4229 domain-containing protein n=1 Tax=Nocardioides limicola TaxID=2803368 RepID=UPI00193B6A96|nr:DUF4229 domain-containing protein [Nocardioides sp. DJM-14]
MKEFAIYSALRLGLMLTTFVVIAGVWLLVHPSSFNLVFAVVAAFLVSGLIALTMLDRRREEFARKIQARADRAAAKLEERRARED